jgi:phage-related protein
LNNDFQKSKFDIEFLEGAVEFLEHLDEKVRDKVIYNITKARYSTDKELFKKLNGDIWDKRSEAETLIIATHGLIKKSGKTPQADLDKATRLRKLYLTLNVP